jgi:hypothetical protein
MKGEVAEILVEGQQDTLVTHCPGQDRGVRASRCVSSDPGDIMPGITQHLHGIQREILIRQEPHWPPRQAT